MPLMKNNISALVALTLFAALLTTRAQDGAGPAMNLHLPTSFPAPADTEPAAYDNVVRPPSGPTRQLRFQFQFLLPKSIL